MDIQFDNNKPSFPKSLYKSSASYQKGTANDPIVIDNDDSGDSDYGTSSTLSRSRSTSESSPQPETTDKKLVNLESVKLKSENQQTELIYYADKNFDTRIYVPWMKCVFRKEDHASNSIPKDDEPIVISDSDTDDNDSATPQSKKRTSGKRAHHTISPSNNIIVLDSDEEDDPNKYYNLEFPDGEMKKIPYQYMANALPPEPDEQLRPGTRVIARRNSDLFPGAHYKGKGGFVMYPNDDNAFYVGILSEHNYVENGVRTYFVFFDDGHAQYVSSENIRVVMGNFGSRYVHRHARQFYDYYFTCSQRKKIMEIVFSIDKHIRVFLNGAFEWAEVFEYDPDKPAIVGVHFLESHQVEFLYAGSPRFELIWTKIVKDKKFEQINDANTTMLEVSSDSEDDETYKSPEKRPLPPDARDPLQKTVMLRPNLLIRDIKPPRRLDRHYCSHRCIEEYESNKQIFDFDPLKRPLLAGWQRNITSNCCTYITPCGRLFATIEQTHKYLINTKSKLSIDCFSYSNGIECMTEVRSVTTPDNTKYLNDLIPGGWKEKQRIPVVSIGGNVPHFNEYVTQYRRNPRSKKVPAILNETNNPFRSCCDCVDDCSNKSKCSCWRLTLSHEKRNVGYKYKRLHSKVDTGIYECNSSCKCSSNCLNRVVKSQIEQKLELYETKDRGYGIRCQNDLPKGTFISCYFGDLLHGKTADERAMKKVGSIHGDEYFMQLDCIEMAEHYKDGYESDVVEDLKEIESAGSKTKWPRYDERLKRTNDPQHTRNLISFFPEIEKQRAEIEITQRTILFGEKSVEFVVDGRYRGNISRFFNHSCEPNLFSQTVFVETHDLRFPWIAFFASDDIKAGTELTWDYSYQIGSIEGRQMECRCGSKYCHKRLL